MGIRFYCPNGHKLNVKSFQAGRRGICPYCGASMLIPTESTRPPSGKKDQGEGREIEMHATAQSLGQPRAAPAAQAKASPTAQPVVQPIPSPTSTPLDAPKSPTAGHVEPAAVTPPTPSTPATPPTPVAPGAADPLAEAPNAVWYVRPAAGGQYGPATSDIMRTWLAEGRIAADTLVWREGWRDWKEAAEVFAQLQPDDMALFLSGQAKPVVPGSHSPSVRHKSSASTGLIIAILILTVLVLFLVFLVVLFRQPRVEAASSAPAATAAWFRPSSLRVGRKTNCPFDPRAEERPVRRAACFGSRQAVPPCLFQRSALL